MVPEIPRLVSYNNLMFLKVNYRLLVLIKSLRTFSFGILNQELRPVKGVIMVMFMRKRRRENNVIIHNYDINI